MLSKQPPNRISDLRLQSITGEISANLYSRLTWTAPSASPETPDEPGKFFKSLSLYNCIIFNTFPVPFYELKYSAVEEDLTDQFEKCLNLQMVDNATVQPVAPGQSITADVFIYLGNNGNFFIAIRAIGPSGDKVSGLTYIFFFLILIFVLHIMRYYIGSSVEHCSNHHSFNG